MVTPPESPVGIGRSVRIERGCRRASVPISVAHVSAVAAAYAPPNANAQRGSWVALQASAQSVAIAPFARTCPASRGPAFPMSTISRLRDLPKRDSATDGMKNARRTRVKPTVPVAYVSAPTMNAESAPPGVRARARSAVNAIAAARTAPTRRLCALRPSPPRRARATDRRR
jgi:hypothetical protein